jgi:hypothetical protein
LSNALTTPATWQHEQAGKTETVEQLIRRAHHAQADSTEKLSASKLSRLIRQYVAAYGIVSAQETIDTYYSLTYEDITGETAIYNLLAVNR